MSTKKVMILLKLLLAVFAVLFLVVPMACQHGSTTPPTGPPPDAPAVYIDLAANDMKFDKDTITVPVGSEVYVNFNNQDDDKSYNFSVYTKADAQTPMFVGEAVAGQAQTTYRFPAGKTAGTYYFRCDLYPINMHGDFVVTPAEPAATGTP
jgi:plastocyanin